MWQVIMNILAMVPYLLTPLFYIVVMIHVRVDGLASGEMWSEISHSPKVRSLS